MEYSRVWSMKSLAKGVIIEINDEVSGSHSNILASIMISYFDGNCDDYIKKNFERVFNGLYYRKRNPRQIALKFSRQFASIKKLTVEDRKVLSGLCALIAEKSN